jgi:hypothetical protein
MDIKQILKKHVLWLEGDTKGEKANLSGAILMEANLSRANLSRANLTGTILPNFQIVPEEGDFIGFKKLRGKIIAKLLIPAKAKKVNSTGRKCRAEFVKVLELTDLEGKAVKGIFLDKHTGELEYKKGIIVRPDSFNDDIREECTNGIHFFLSRKEAIDY